MSLELAVSTKCFDFVKCGFTVTFYGCKPCGEKVNGIALRIIGILMTLIAPIILTVGFCALAYEKIKNGVEELTFKRYPLLALVGEKESEKKVILKAIQVQIACFLTIKDLSVLAQTSRGSRSIADDPAVWRFIANKRFIEPRIINMTFENNAKNAKEIDAKDASAKLVAFKQPNIFKERVRLQLASDLEVVKFFESVCRNDASKIDARIRPLMRGVYNLRRPHINTDDRREITKCFKQIWAELAAKELKALDTRNCMNLFLIVSYNNNGVPLNRQAKVLRDMFLIIKDTGWCRKHVYEFRLPEGIKSLV